MRNAVLIAAVGCGAIGVAALVWSWPAREPDAPAAQSPAAQPVPQPTAAAPSAAEPAPAPATAEELTQQARRELERDPAAALRAVEQADRLAGPGDERRCALEIDALVRLGRVGHARALADQFYRAFPGSPEIPRLERLTGYHPRPHGPER